MQNRRSAVGRGFLYGLYSRRLRRELAGLRLPRHVAMIIDGNRRWAKQRLLETAAHGHRAGAEKVREFLSWCDELGIKVATLYLLSSDNLSHRDPEELRQLFDIIGDLADELSRTRDWRIKHVGRAEGLPTPLVEALEAAEARTAGNRGLHVNLAVGYGGRREISDAVHSIIDEHSAQGGTLDDLGELLTPENIGEHLYTSGQPELDLIIRTSGEQRLSDFMLWQSAHSELYFMEALGPDLREIDFLRALRDYGGRDRRYGS
ncbi:isoprenyl transferase [Ruicaihuangia caeni]|uniref:Isoprenyl transferase n=1 Tax=Ruicaihuangia caeni TaxID=3042517 RepID=A0AAW6TEJ7_9MICO|nr:isoprenyl transferase [Klugiella sp. YN-L-19]MDI2099497.1 isoprenyl transferase [Klugiella sp. YN-L-19]